MEVQLTTSAPFSSDADAIAVGLFEDSGAPSGLSVPQGASGKLGRVTALQEQGRWLLVCGLGPRERFDPEAARVAAAAGLARATELSTQTLCWQVPDAGESSSVAAGLVEGTLLRGYRFDRYRPAPEDPRVQKLLISGPEELREPVDRAAVVGAAQNRARALGDTPANDLTPTALAEYAQELASRHPTLSATVLDESAIREAGMGAFAAVAQGSAQEARLIRLDYNPDGADGPLLGMVGKGVTFDTGGISLKSRSDMDEMKFDMCGAAAVIEAVAALAELSVPGRVMAVVGATENMPGGGAIKPGDIVTTLEGKTIEINNTDAEGRLVLSDCLTYARQEGCERLVDLATLTGGVVIALGSVYAGLMSNDDEWCETVRSCAERAGEGLWRLPLHERYAEMVKGRYAELTNLAARREAQPITAAELMHPFVGEVPWAHIDIAGTSWDVPRPYYAGKGATGFGVRLLVEVASQLATRG